MDKEASSLYSDIGKSEPKTNGTAEKSKQKLMDSELDESPTKSGNIYVRSPAPPSISVDDIAIDATDRKSKDSRSDEFLFSDDTLRKKVEVLVSY